MKKNPKFGEKGVYLIGNPGVAAMLKDAGIQSFGQGVSFSSIGNFQEMKSLSASPSS